MLVQEKPRKAVVSVVEMSEMLAMSKSRFYALMLAGVFPQPVRNECCKRPVFDLESQQKCLDIKRSGVGANGLPVLFNRKRRRSGPTKSRTQLEPVPSVDHSDMIEALKSLGLTATSEMVEEGLRTLYPDGWAEIGQGELVRRVFLQLQTRK